MPEHIAEGSKFHFDIPFEEINLKTDDGAVLNALHFEVERPKGVVLYFHGNAGELSRWGLVTEKFTEYGYDVLVMDFRTYGKSTGKLSEAALYSDAQLFYDYLKKRYSEDKIVVYGRSLGTTFATYVASKNNPKKLLLEAPFYNLTEVAESRFFMYPVSWFLKYEFPTNQFIKKVKCPIIIFHGTEDITVPFENSKKLLKIIPKGQVEFISLTDGNHNNLVNYKQYKETLEQSL